MATAKKLPSGSWRVNLYVGKDAAGKRQYKSFTADTKKEAEFMAASYNVEKRHRAKPAELTVGEAIDQYIATKTAVLSPSTIVGYKQLRRNAYGLIEGTRLRDLTQDDVQCMINTYTKNHSPKSVRNASGLLTAALSEYAPDFIHHTKLPAKVRPKIAIPDDADVHRLIEAAKGTEMETVFVLAAALGLRRSEICPLTWEEDFDEKNHTLSITKAMVADDNYNWIVKAPKSYAGSRVLALPDVVFKYLDTKKKTNGRIISLNPDGITARFTHLRAEAGLEHFRFHDLRHYNASIMLSLGVPDKYAMERMGHATPNMLKTVYQHTMQQKQKEVAQKVNDYLDSAFKL